MTAIKTFLRSKNAILLFFLIALILAFAVLSGGGTLRPSNIVNILQSITIVSLLTIGAGTLMIAGEIDLSLGGIGTMSAFIAALLLKNGVPWFGALLAAVAVGAFVGLINGFLVNELGFQSFIATLATTSITTGVGYIFTGGMGVTIEDPVFRFIGNEFIGGYIPFSVLIAVIALVVYAVLLNKTKFGRSVYLVGGNRAAARIAGLKPKKILYGLFINAGALAALAGTLLASKLLVANTVGITSSQFAGLTAAILGGISFGGGTGGMGGAVIGIFILSCFNNGMTMVNIQPYWQTVASGALLLAAISMDFLSTARRKKSEVKI
ncbi:MAG: ABC transporter permease [Clostridiales Family XIII bacterium]|jgi:ribose/xylose/arabinose/galactoside ABC-type transport system permease subunit|nr:ABC transporter permease [Clostridiales Family XIII bacterium]